MKNFFASIVLVILISSCCTAPNTEYFDISTPESHAGYNYNLEIFVNTNAMYGNKMVFTKEPHSIYFDGFNLWAQTPSQMLTSYFKQYFNNVAAPRIKKEPPIKLNIEVLKLECSLTKKECLFYAEVSAINTAKGKLLFSKIYKENLPMKELTASSFASSMANAVMNVTKKIEKQLKNTYKINSGKEAGTQQ